MVANVDWANVAPDNDNNNTMAYLFPTEVPSNRVGVAKAVLTCRPDSHPFPERTLLLHQPVKVRLDMFVNSPIAQCPLPAYVIIPTLVVWALIH